VKRRKGLQKGEEKIVVRKKGGGHRRKKRKFSKASREKEKIEKTSRVLAIDRGGLQTLRKEKDPSGDKENCTPRREGLIPANEQKKRGQHGRKGAVRQQDQGVTRTIGKGEAIRGAIRGEEGGKE